MLNSHYTSPSYLYFRSIIIPHVDLAAETGLEVGAFDRPFFGKDECKVKFLDYRSTEEAVAYAKMTDGHQARDVVPIDFVVRSSEGWDQVPDQDFDWVFSSQVLEHVPNLIGFILTLSQKLKVGGRLISIVPDKRYTFDIDRPLTTIGKLIREFLTNKDRPDVQDALDHFYYHRAVNGSDVWTGLEKSENVVRHADNFKFALDVAKRAADSYRDSHVSVFTSESFFAIFKELCDSRILPFSIRAHTATMNRGISFCSILERIR